MLIIQEGNKLNQLQSVLMANVFRDSFRDMQPQNAF